MSQTQTSTSNAATPSTSTLVLDIKDGNLAAGTQVIVWSQNVPASPNQVWVFSSDGHIRCQSNPNLVLDIYGGVLDSGREVIVWTENFPASSNQLWFLTGDGHIASQGNRNLVLDITGGDLAPGTPVIVYSQNNPASPNQLWAFTSDGHIQQSAPATLTVNNNGGYVANCTITYVINGVQQSQSSTITLGQSFSVSIPTGATAIHFVGIVPGLSGDLGRSYTDVATMGTQKVLTLNGTAFDPGISESGGSSLDQTAGQVVVHHNGGYTARCWVTYTVNSQNQNQSSGDFYAGSTFSAPLPAGATNVHIKCEEDTGLAWDPVRTIFDQTYPTFINVTYTISGTTLNPSFSQQ